ncbi:MAG: NAD(P)H-hydrate dehydratase [Bryobacteraceae bacterium]
MKILTAVEMREVDRRTIELGIPGIVLMENAGARVVDLLVEKWTPLSEQRIVVLCGKGNNGGDGLVVARQLFTRFHPRALHVVLAANPTEFQGDAAANFRMLEACGCPWTRELPPDADLVIDALLGTGLKGPATGPMLEWIRRVNAGFPSAKVVAVDIPSGLPDGEAVRADYTVTFTALKLAHALPPACDRMGELRLAAIGSPPALFANVWLSLSQPRHFEKLLAPRDRAAHKGTFGHALVVGGAQGKTGAASMAGTAALRAGAGLVTVASSAASYPPELMTAALPQTYEEMLETAQGKNVLALGPGLGRCGYAVRAVEEFPSPMVVDADGLNAIAGAEWRVQARLRVLTPHPGEMGRLAGISTAEVQANRLAVAREFACARNVCLVLKGQRTLIAFPDGRVFVNPTGTPALATGGAGDILTGLIAGLLAQFPEDAESAVLAGVYLHGLAGEFGASELGEKCLVATDILRYLPRALEECARLPDRL